MLTTNNSKPNAEKKRAKNILSIYHEDASLEAKLHRKELYFQLLVLIQSSPYWMATPEDVRADILHLVVSQNEKDDALDVLYGEEVLNGEGNV